MLSLAWWWVLLIAPLPLLIRFASKPLQTKRETALYVPFYSSLASPEKKGDHSVRFRLPDLNLSLLILIWVSLLIAAARPIWLGESVALPVSGRDLMMAVDISGSMEEHDFAYGGNRLTRLQAVKAVAGEFIERRQGDRVGLILFGTQAYVQTPLTFDLKTVRHFLEEAVIGLAGQNTSIGDAIGLSVKRLRERPAQSRLLILLTDGSNTSGLVSPQEASRLAAKEDIRIHTIGVGAEARVGGLFNFFSQRGRPLDEKSLKEIADATGGRYFRARDLDELGEIYALIDELEPTEVGDDFYRPLTELYYWPLILMGLLITVLYWRRRAA
ncbi:MAG: VWA domain-containing protein [Pseudomonadota bacterium]